jgi:hypothetical protein
VAVEEAFRIAIPDEDAEQMLTPSDVVTYVFGRVGTERGHGCAEQRVLQTPTREHDGIRSTAETIRPATRWDDVLPSASAAELHTGHV